MIQLFSSVVRIISKSNFSFPTCSRRVLSNSNSFQFPVTSRFGSSFPDDDGKGNSKKRSCKFEAVRLKSRSLIRLKGPDTGQLLQGLITNDIEHLESRPAIYALFLNNQGRVLWDTVLYSVPEAEDSQILVECDSAVKSNLIKHLKTFKLRKKVDIVDVEEEKDVGVDLWVVFDHGHTTITKELAKEECCGPVLQQTSKRPELPLSVDTSLRSFGDPRLNELGWRVFVPKNKENLFPPKDITVTTEESYKRLRYVLGVPEGVEELPTGNCFPLESNGDYLHGISFQKGCYIGQELTARTHHTGVVRKRIMPFRLPESTDVKEADISSLQIVNPAGKSLGKVRGIFDSYGLGLIRIEEAISTPELQIKNIASVTIEKPFWWPIEASKERQTR